MQNSIYKIKYLLFLSWDWEAWCLTQSGGNNPPERNTAWNKGRKSFHCLGAPNNLIRPCLYYKHSMPSTCFGHNCGHPQGSALQRIQQKRFERVYSCEILSFKICGLKYILKYQIRIKFCGKGKCVTNVLCGHYVLVAAIKLIDFCKRVTHPLTSW